MSPVELTDDERRLLVNMITVEIEASKFPLSPRIEALKRIREKLRGDDATPREAKQRQRSSAKVR